jgi:hypothetical protein
MKTAPPRCLYEKYTRQVFVYPACCEIFTENKIVKYAWKDTKKLFPGQNEF